MKSISYFPFSLILILSILSCNPILEQSKNIDILTPVKSPTIKITATKAYTPIIALTPSIRMTGSPTIMPTSKSDQSIYDEKLSLRSNLAVNTPIPAKTPDQALVDWLISAWQKREDPTKVKADLASILNNERYLSPMYEQEGQHLMLVTDLDGDGLDEWIITIFTAPGKMALCSELTCGEIGEIWIVNEEGLVYRLFNGDSDWFGPIVIAQTDLTGDDLPDVVTQSTFMGAHTLTLAYHVLSAHNGKITNVVRLRNELAQVSAPYRLSNDIDKQWSTAGIELTNASQTVKDRNGDGLADLVIQGGSFGSIGAGNCRDRTEVWAWDGENITLAEVFWSKPEFRIHVLFDADYAFALKDYKTAEAVYKRAISDNTLKDALFFHPTEEIYPISLQYAAFRLIHLNLIQKDAKEAKVWQEWLREKYPDSPLTKSAEILLDSWQNSEDLTEACFDVTKFLYAYEGPTIWPLNDTGYGNPEITVGTLCPIR